MSDEEIDRMVREAEEYADEDRKIRERVEAKNQAESMIHSVQKSVEEMGDKLDASEKSNIDAAVKDLQDVLEGDDVDIIKEKTTALAEASHKLAEQMYKQASEETQDAPEYQDSGESENADDNVVDAEFEEVKDDDKKA